MAQRKSKLALPVKSGKVNPMPEVVAKPSVSNARSQSLTEGTVLCSTKANAKNCKASKAKTKKNVFQRTAESFLNHVARIRLARKGNVESRKVYCGQANMEQGDIELQVRGKKATKMEKPSVHQLSRATDDLSSKAILDLNQSVFKPVSSASAIPDVDVAAPVNEKVF
ncbi:hypothetical protein EB796_018948 [Bugula neritina]|uniref:Uncharacterized protein n=1 Tax=Bugula neritina TaxID=10212 RepID=A0A7J7J931_BUGNE|nr:hypothetical protein EB796_018948 [Bugula neritina]